MELNRSSPLIRTTRFSLPTAVVKSASRTISALYRKRFVGHAISRRLVSSADRGVIRREGQVDKSIIRITSAHKWPEMVVYDTSQPTVVALPISVAAEASVPLPSASTREAFAKIASVTPPPERTLLHPKQKLKRKSPNIRIVAAREPSYSWPAGW